MGTEIDTRIAMIAITIINSISVKPPSPERIRSLIRRIESRSFIVSSLVAYHSRVHHQVLYLVPSSAVPWLLLYTSYTFCPPKLSASGGSWLDRNPQSVLPDIGSTGIARRNRIFLSFTSTPFTSVCRSGG